ncbi:uncharacterized protein LOC142339943 [Convolutriloba macropyga]|uniref:uncharacterized protein LOC142339943 n=1 Tax=Convolutriloba macropyga TaxID=536237 RepID=UPI003F526625
MFCKSILLIAFFVSQVSSLEPCKVDSTCKCENGLIAECTFVKHSHNAIYLVLSNLPPTNFSSNFYISNVDTEDWLELQKVEETKLLFIDIINSSIGNYTNLLRYLELMEIRILHLHFQGVGINEEDHEGLRELLMGASKSLEGLFFHDYLPRTDEIDLRDLHLDKLQIFQYDNKNSTATVKFDSLTTLASTNQNYISMVQNHFDMPGFLLRNVRMGNEFMQYYIYRTVKRQCFEWKPELLEENYFLPHIFSSPYPPQHWYEDVVIKLGPNQDNTAPKILTKEFLLHAGAVTLLCLPDTLEQIEYGALSTMKDMKAIYIGLYSPNWDVTFKHGCTDVLDFAEMTNHGLWFSQNCKDLPSFHCQLCFMHNFGLHKIKDNVAHLCSSRSTIPPSMTRQCYWDDPIVVSQLPALPLLGPLIDESRTPNCPPTNFQRMSIR